MSERSHNYSGLGAATRAIHLGYEPSENQGALTPPVYMTSTYAFESVEQGAAIFRGEEPGFIYGRTKNPTQQLLEQRLASLEGAEEAMVAASGMAAISSTLWALLQAGDAVVIDQTLYGNSFALFTKGVTKFGIETRIADLTDMESLERALEQTPVPKLIYLETPANPNLRLIDIVAVAERAHAAGARVIVDNTFCTPLLQRPLELGADLVVHSATKFLGGHGDLLGGVVAGPAETIKSVRMEGLRWLTGATMAPLVAFLILRGLKTLKLRMAYHSEAGRQVAGFLADHPKVASVSYPGLAGSATEALAKRQMSDSGGLLALELKGGFEAGRQFLNALRIVKRAVSLGDAETLAQHPASMTHATYTPEERASYGIGEGLIRLSIGLEDTEDIVADFEQALDCVTADGL